MEALAQVMAPLDPEMAAMVQAQLRAKGVELVLGTAVAAIAPRGKGLVATLASGRELPADMIMLSVGVRPDTAFARAAGLACSPSGAIVVDAAMRTSDPHIFALGGCGGGPESGPREGRLHPPGGDRPPSRPASWPRTSPSG